MYLIPNQMPDSPLTRTALNELKLLSPRDAQRFANYIGSRLRTIGKIFHEGRVSSGETYFKNWSEEMVRSDHKCYESLH